MLCLQLVSGYVRLYNASTGIQAVQPSPANDCRPRCATGSHRIGRSETRRQALCMHKHRLSITIDDRGQPALRPRVPTDIEQVWARTLQTVWLNRVM